jgi:hypothetical protein
MKSNRHFCARLTLAVLCTVTGIGAAEAQRYQTRYGNATLTFDTGDGNSAFGEQALHYNTTGGFNTATGFFALENNRTGGWNTAYGGDALFLNTSGDYNSAFGESALARNDSGNHNIAIGDSALYGNLSGIRNVAVGGSALNNNNGKFNNATGYAALYHNTTGSNNSASGYAALYSNTSGSNNIGVGPYAGYRPTTGSNNIEIGSRGLPADNAVIRIGTPGKQERVYLAGVSDVNVTGGAPVMVTATGQLGVVSSSRRYKEGIRSMGNTSDRLLGLRPVTFRYKKADENGRKPEQYGLIAEEVAKVMPELVVYNEQGQPETVAYQALAPLLVNELQIEHRRAEQQKQETDDLRHQLATVTAQLTELRQVTAHLAAKK